MAQRKKPEKAKQPAPDATAAEPFMVTSVRIRPTHWRALHEDALKLAGPGTGRRADASAVLREVLDKWLAERG